MDRSGLIVTVNRHAWKASRRFTSCTIPDRVSIALVGGSYTMPNCCSLNKNLLLFKIPKEMQMYMNECHRCSRDFIHIAFKMTLRNQHFSGSNQIFILTQNWPVISQPSHFLACFPYLNCAIVSYYYGHFPYRNHF